MEFDTDRNDTVGLHSYLQNKGAYDRILFSLPEDVRSRVEERADWRSFRTGEELRSFVSSLLNKS